MSMLHVEPLTKEVHRMEGYVIVTIFIWELEDYPPLSTGAIGANGDYVRNCG